MSSNVHDRDHTENGSATGDRRLAGVAGIAFVAWIVIAAIVYAGLIPQPAYSAPDTAHVGYFAGNSTALALHAWLSGVFWVLCFLTFAVRLRYELAARDAAAAMWADLAFGGALMASVFGGVGVAIETVATSITGSTAGTLAPLLGRLLALDYETLLYWGLAVYVGSGSIALLRGGRGLHRIAWLGLADLVALVVGAAWPLTGDDRGLLGATGLIGLFVAAAWTLAVAVWLLRADARATDRRPDQIKRATVGGATVS